MSYSSCVSLLCSKQLSGQQKLLSDRWTFPLLLMSAQHSVRVWQCVTWTEFSGIKQGARPIQTKYGSHLRRFKAEPASSATCGRGLKAGDRKQQADVRTLACCARARGGNVCHIITADGCSAFTAETTLPLQWKPVDPCRNEIIIVRSNKRWRPGIDA